MTAPTGHLQPQTELARRALLPGDPARALALAQALLDGPRMFNHHRGLWGYSGPAADGELLTIQSTGLGGPATAIVGHELARLGVEVMVRVGTARALADDLPAGTIVAAERALTGDGTSRALGADGPLAGDPGLTATLSSTAGRSATVLSTDLFYAADGARPGEPDTATAAGAEVTDLSTATLFALARRHGVRAGALLLVTGAAGGADAVEPAPEDVERLGAAAARAVLAP